MRISDWSSDVCSSDLTQALASSAAPSPKAAAVDQTSEPVRIPAATVRPYLRPDFIEVPAMASVAGPGLAEASSAAARISGRGNPSVMTQALPGRTVEGKRGNVSGRSEEHTSERQSRMAISYAVLRLKKNNKENSQKTTS